MLKRVLIASAILTLVIGPVTYAEDLESVLMLNASQIAMIRTNCQSVQATLTGIHSSDALSRVHLGQEHETIASWL